MIKKCEFCKEEMEYDVNGEPDVVCWNCKGVSHTWTQLSTKPAVKCKHYTVKFAGKIHGYLHWLGDDKYVIRDTQFTYADKLTATKHFLKWYEGFLLSDPDNVNQTLYWTVAEVE